MESDRAGRPATVSPMTLAELKLGLAGPAVRTREGLRRLHEMLMRSTASQDAAPVASLVAAASLVPSDVGAIVATLAPRPRVVFRLLAAQAYEAAWAVLIDNAAGVVKAPALTSTAMVAAGSARRLPLVTRLEPPRVYADLPGFRDPRYAAPDACYDITDLISLAHGLDEVVVHGSGATLAGWAALRLHVTSVDEQVRLILARDHQEVEALGRRVRRSDLVSGKGEDLVRRAWAGWSVDLDLSDPRLRDGVWTLSLELDHAGIVRRTPIGSAVSDLAVRGARGVTMTGSGTARWDVGPEQWRLMVTPLVTT